MALKAGERQMAMIIPNVEELVSADHRDRKMLAIVDWVELAKPLRNLYSKVGRRGYAVEQGLKCLFLQFLEDRSDRQMEQLLCDSKELKRRAISFDNGHSMVIKKNNAKDKNRKKDSYFSSLRMPFEGTFSKVSSRGPDIEVGLKFIFKC